MLRQAQHERAWRYAIGLGSNRGTASHALPRSVLRAALGQLTRELTILSVSRFIATPPIGPSARRFANAAALIETPFDPPALLTLLKRIEGALGRRRGQRWGARSIDLDILLWSGGRWSDRVLTIPHAHIAERRFVLDPLAEIAPDWRLPGSALRVRHLKARLTRGRSRL